MTESYEARTLDQSGPSITKKPTGYTEPGSLSAELFFDPALAGHRVITGIIEDPSIPSGEDYLADGSITFADADSTEWTFSASGIGLDISIQMNDGLKGTVNMDLAEVIAYPDAA